MSNLSSGQSYMVINSSLEEVQTQLTEVNPPSLLARPEEAAYYQLEFIAENIPALGYKLFNYDTTSSISNKRRRGKE